MTLEDQPPVVGGTTAIRDGQYVREERTPGPVLPHRPMTDNGLSALAAALIKGSYLNGSWFDHEEECAAAILGERGVFLPSVPYEGDDRTICECGLDMDSHAGGFALLHHDGFVAREQAATIADDKMTMDLMEADALRAALTVGTAYPKTYPDVLALEADLLRFLRAALTTKEADG